jgi:GT2 family glycosyltransferase
VIIPSHEDRGHLTALLKQLTQQPHPVKEIIISHSGSGNPDRQIPQSRIPIKVLHQDAQLYSGAARNRAAAKATGKWLAFVDDDVLPAADWSAAVAELLTQSSEDECVVGSVEVAQSGGYWGMCLWFVEFGSVHRYMPSRPIEGGASANMLIARSLFEAAGGFPETVKRSVDVEFMARCRAQGGHTRFDSRLAVAHHNIPGLEHCRQHAYRLGRGSARVRLLAPLRGHFFIRHPYLAYLMVPLRLGHMIYRVGRWGTGQRASFIRHLPGIVYTLTSWSRGFSNYAWAARSKSSPIL